MAELTKMNDFPHVTQILEPWVDFSKVDPDVLEHAANRGTKVHKHCAAIAKGLWLPRPEEELKGYIESFKKWFALVTEVALAEETLIDRKLGYQGTPDLVVKIEGVNGLILCDLKTSIALQKTWELQIAAYWNLCVANNYDVNPLYCGSLRLNKDGKIAKMDYIKDIYKKFNIFLGGLNIYRYFKGG